MEDILIIKNDGRKELLNVEKIHKHLAQACDGLADVDSISLIKNARLRFFNNMKSIDIQNSLIKAAQEMISEETPDYELVAGRLLNQKIRKEVYGQFIPKDFKEQVKLRIKNKFYTKDLLKYSDEELDFYGSLIDYDLDDEMIYSSLNQLYSKYLIKHNGKLIETPQEAFILIPMAIFYNCTPEYRRKYIKLGYDLLSKKKISLPTPIMNGARTPYKKFISCNLINFGDSVDSFAKATAAILSCTAEKSGLGINTSFIRGLGADVGKPSRMKHTGLLPLVKTIESATGALQQIGRGGCMSKDSEVLVVDYIEIDGKRVNLKDIENMDVKVYYKKVKIQDVKVGDFVKSFDILQKKDVIKPVINTYTPIVKKNDQRKISFQDGGYIINSKKHPILVKRENNFYYLKFDELFIGDIVLGENGLTIISKLEEIQTDSEQFYDIEVQDTHNYYGGKNGVYCNHNSSNLTLPFFHYEVELFAQLGDSKGSLENRARHTDQTIIVNKWFLEKALNKEDIFLFYMNEVGNKDRELDLYDALGDYERFDKLYNYYAEKISNKHKKKINAWNLLSLILFERMVTGRVYITFADNFVKSSYKENLYFTNLCCLAGETKVQTLRGVKDIKNIKSGELVLSYNVHTDKREWKKVLSSQMTHPEREVLEIDYNGIKITCTPDHRFLTKRGYVQAQDLLENDELILDFENEF